MSQRILMWNIKTLALTVQKLLARLKFSKNGSNSKFKITRSNIFVPKNNMVPNLWSLEHKNFKQGCSLPSSVEIDQWFWRRISPSIFCYFIIIPPGKRAWPFAWTNLNPLQPRKLCAKFGWNWPSASNGKAILNLKEF